MTTTDKNMVKGTLTLEQWAKDMFPKREFTEDEKKLISEAKAEIEGRIGKFMGELSNG